MLKEVFGLYDAARMSEPLDLPVPRPFREHIDHLERLDLSEAESYWRALLRGFSNPTPLPGASAVPVDYLESSSGSGERETRLSESATSRLKDFAAAHGLSLNTFVQAAWALVLSRHSGEHDVVFGAIRACRRSSVEGADAIVGTFINTVPVRVHVDEDRRLVDWLKEIRTGQRDVWRFENTPLVHVQKWCDVPAGRPLFESILVYDDVLLDSQLRDLGGPWLRRHFQLREQTNFPLTLYGNSDRELRLAISYDRKRLSADSVDRLLRQLTTLLEEFPCSADRQVGELTLLGEDEQRQVLYEWNDTAVDYPRDGCIHHFFEDQVHRTPQATAITYENEELTYAELNERAECLAQYLIERGIGPDVLVGVCIERSLEMVVAILGVLKAGARVRAA